MAIASPPDYTRELKHIADALSRPGTPTWVVSLVSAFFGLLTGVIAEPMKAWTKDRLDRQNVQSRLCRALAPNAATLKRMEYLLTSGKPSAKVLSIYVDAHLSTVFLDSILENSKETVLELGLFEEADMIRNFISTIKNNDGITLDRADLTVFRFHLSLIRTSCEILASRTSRLRLFNRLVDKEHRLLTRKVYQ